MTTDGNYRVFFVAELVVSVDWNLPGDNSEPALVQKVQDAIGHTGAIVHEVTQGEGA